MELERLDEPLNRVVKEVVAPPTNMATLDDSSSSEDYERNQDSTQVVEKSSLLENDMYAPLYQWTYCFECGSTRRKTFLNDNEQDLVCEYCTLLGKNIYRLPKLVWHHLTQDPAESENPIQPDTTLNSVTDYLVEELLPALECRFTEKQSKLLSKSEPVGPHKNGLSPEYNNQYLNFSTLIKSKEVERAKTKEKLMFNDRIEFDSRSVPVGTLFSTRTKDLHVSLDLLLDDGCILIKLRTVPVSSLDRGKEVSSPTKMATPSMPGQLSQLVATPASNKKPSNQNPTYPNMTVDYSNQLELRTLGGKIESGGKQNESLKLESHKVKLSPKGDSVVIKSIPLSKLENRGFFSSLLSTKSDMSKLYLEWRIIFFVIDASFGEAYDEMINAKLTNVLELNDKLFRECQEDVKLTLGRLEKARVTKEEISVLRRKYKEQMAPKPQDKGYKEILDDITKPYSIAAIVLLGFFAQLLLIVNPTLRNRAFF